MPARSRTSSARRGRYYQLSRPFRGCVGRRAQPLAHGVVAAASAASDPGIPLLVGRADRVRPGPAPISFFRLPSPPESIMTALRAIPGPTAILVAETFGVPLYRYTDSTERARS